MSYTRVNWEDAPSVATPLSASNLNKMDAGIKQNADDIETLQQHTYDSALNGISTNAPQTKVVKKAIDDAIEEATVLVDPTLSNEGQAADAKATGDAVANVKSAIHDVGKTVYAELGHPIIGLTDLAGISAANGVISNSGRWININDNYQHKYIPLPGTGGRLTVTAGSNATYIGVVKSYVAPVLNASIDFSAASGFTGRISLSALTSYSYDLPDDAVGIIVVTKYGTNGAVTPSAFSISFPTGTTIQNVASLLDRVSAIEEGGAYYNRDDLTGLTQHQGNLSSTKTWNNINAKYTHVVVPVVGGMEIEVGAQSSVAAYFAVLRSYSTPVNGAAVDYSTATGWDNFITVASNNTFSNVLPDDAKYVVVMVLRNNKDYSPATFSVTYNAAEKIKWLAMGDSITEGFYSVTNEGTEDTENHLSKSKCYAQVCATYKGFSLDNKGVGGSGWVKRGTAGAPKPNVRDQLDAETIDFTKYDVVTAMFGVNDWKGSQNLGAFSDGTNPETESVYGNMRYFVETVQAANPAIKIILITPVNCRQDTQAVPSTAENNWGIGYAFDGKTLEDYYTAIKTVCEYYDIQMVDMLHDSIINRVNAVAMLPDKVHPSLAAHRQMGIGLAGKLLYA